MESLFKSYESENDERLDKKFQYNYQVIKNVYPQVSELPEDEVREIIRKYYDAPGTHEDSMQAVMNYIHEKEPEWKRLYFDDDEQVPVSNNNSILQKNNKMNMHFNRIYNFSQKSIHPKLRAEFDGEKFTVLDEENNTYGCFGAQSGNKQFQYKQATDVKNYGPIPEGEWLLKYSDIEDFKMPYDENLIF